MGLPDYNPRQWFRFDFYKFFRDSFIVISDQEAVSVKLLLTLRGLGMVDVFDIRHFFHVAFLDFDFTRPAALDSAFGSPFIGILFNPQVRRSIGRTVFPF